MVDIKTRVVGCEAGGGWDWLKIIQCNFVSKGCLWIFNRHDIMTSHVYASLVCEILTEVGYRDYNQIYYGRSVIKGCDCTVDRDSTICKDLPEWECHWCITGMYNRLPSERHIACSPPL